VEAAKELLDEGVIIRPECCTPESQSPPLHPQERFEPRPAPGVSWITSSITLVRCRRGFSPLPRYRRKRFEHRPAPGANLEFCHIEL